MSGSYHQGDVVPRLLRALYELIQESGHTAVSMRAIARRAGVSHSAHKHHLGSRAGILTAFAVEGHRRLQLRLRNAAHAELVGLTPFEAGIEYIQFAREEWPFFEVMFLSIELRRNDPEFVSACEVTANMMLAPDRARPIDGHGRPTEDASLTWALAHGCAVSRRRGNGLPSVVEGAYRRLYP